MELKYKVHLDDYHSNITAFGVRTVEGAVAQVRGEIDNGYDVGEITLDGRPLFCSRCEPYTVPAETGGAAVKGLCITHRHAADYQHYSRLGRYMGD